MKTIIYNITFFTFIILIISCNRNNKENNNIYINSQSTNNYIQGTEIEPINTGYKKIDDILNKYKYKMMIYEISELISEKGINGTLDENIESENNNYIIAFKGSTPLFLAVQYAYDDLADELIKENADINVIVKDTEIKKDIDILYYAVKNNNNKMTKFLIDKGLYAGRDYGEEYHYYLTDIAIRNNNLEILKLLIESKDANLESALMAKAVDQNNIEMVKYLISIGQDVNAKIFYNEMWFDSPMKVAAQNGNIEIAKLLIDKGANLNSSDDYIYNAVYYGSYDIVKLLIDNDIFNINTNSTKEEAIYLAKNQKYYEIEKLLSSKNTETIDGYDDIMNAISKGDIKTLEKLIKNDTDLNKQYDKITPINLAVTRNDKDIVKLLAEKNADMNLEDGYGYSPLMKAFEYYNSNLIMEIIDLNADLNTICSANGETPLTRFASMSDYTKLAYYMIKNGADVNKQNNNGYTPLMIAVANRNYSILELFANMNADYNIKNNEGKTVLDMAADNEFALYYLNNPKTLETNFN